MELNKDTVKAWWLQTTGEAHYKSALDGMYQKTITIFDRLRKATHDLVEEGVITSAHNKRDGYYRLVVAADEEIIWWEGEDIDDSKVNLLLPFNLHKACYISKPALITVSGDTNAGKTAMVLNIMNLNLEKFPPTIDGNGHTQRNIKLLMTQGIEQLKGRLYHIRPQVPKPPPFSTHRKVTNFEDDVLPNGLTLIDWLRPPNPESLMSVGNKLEAIYSKLGPGGIAVVAMQKPRGERSEAFGGIITEWDAELAISIHGKDNPRYLKLSKIKKPLILDRNLYALKVKFNINNGIKLEELEKVYE